MWGRPTPRPHPPPPHTHPHTTPPSFTPDPCVACSCLWGQVPPPVHLWGVCGACVHGAVTGACIPSSHARHPTPPAASNAHTCTPTRPRSFMGGTWCVCVCGCAEGLDVPVGRAAAPPAPAAAFGGSAAAGGDPLLPLRNHPQINQVRWGNGGSMCVCVCVCVCGGPFGSLPRPAAPLSTLTDVGAGM